MHLTNCNLNTFNVFNSPIALRMSLYLDSNPDRMNDIKRLTKLAFYLVDRIASLRLSDKAKSISEKNRKKAEKEKKKEKTQEQEEEILKKKRDKEQAYQDKLKSLPPDQQRKLEEKKRLKDLQKTKQKMSKVVKY